MSTATTPSKPQNRYTQQSDANSEESCEFVGGFQFKVLPAPNKSKFSHFDDLPKNQLKIRQTQDPKKPSINLPTPDNLLAPDNPLHQKQGSFVDIKISNYPSNGEFDSVKIVEPLLSPSSEKSSNHHSFKRIDGPAMRKSETEPKFITVNEYEGFAIKTNLVKEEKNFKKEKGRQREKEREREMEREKMMGSNCKSMTFLNAMAPSRPPNLDASRVINQNRVTLKDYLFMANTSSKKAAEIKRKQLNQSKKLKEGVKSGLNSSLNQQSIQIKQRFHKEKYHISNDQMGRVCKQSIKLELNTLSSKIQRISQWLDTHKTVDNQQLIQLYNIRRELQDYNSKMEKSIELLNLPDCRLFSNDIVQMMQDSMVHSDTSSEIEIDVIREEV